MARKEAIKKEFETLYQYLVGRNRVLNLINIDQSDYLGINTPEMDVVYGAVSGIPPESIKDYVEVNPSYVYFPTLILNSFKGLEDDVGSLNMVSDKSGRYDLLSCRSLNPNRL